MSDTVQRIRRALDLIEARLFDERLELAAMARAASFSPWHFHRVFNALTGETPASYVRKRRLAEICIGLSETKEPIVALALRYGFESQATFTRAFTRQIGAPPGRFRKQRLLAPAHLFAPLDLDEIVSRQRREHMEPKITRRAAFHVVGMPGRFTPATTTRIPELWSRFVPRIDEVAHRVPTHTYGVCLDADPATAGEAGFTYVAGVEVERIDAVPQGLIAVTIPESNYAVFTHSGHISRIGDTVKQIWGVWLPQSRHRHVPRPDFESYDSRWDPATGLGEIDIYVPIADD